MKLYAVITLLLSLVMFFFPFISASRIFKENAPEKPTDSTVMITDTKKEKTAELELFDYIVGTVAAEMPASFEEEALKAQAVAAYTYQKYLRENGTDIITDGSIHQEYKTDDELKALWGKDYEVYKKKITDAVSSVYGEYLICNGETVPSVYHAISPGCTENSEVIFKKQVPCLTSVTAPGDKLSPKYSEEISFSKKEASALLKRNGISASSENGKLIEVTDKTKSGYPSEIKIGSSYTDGNKIREIFSLKSPYFDITEDDSDITFTVYGRGHGVGMSQYSADYMARQGFSYRDILLHFYKGAKITG